MEENIVDLHVVVLGQIGQLLRDGKYEVMIFDRQNLFTPLFKPLSASAAIALRTIAVLAGVPVLLAVPALLALHRMPAEHLCATRRQFT